MALVDFIVIGAAKAATSSLCVALQYHPKIHIPARKEINYFSMDGYYKLGPAWYEAQFTGKSDAVTGEGSVSYSFGAWSPETAKRIYDYNPNMRLIYMVREPLSRIVSLYHQFQAAGTLGPLTLLEALESDAKLLDSGRYWQQISRYREFFEDSRIKVIFYEDWVSDPQQVLMDCCDFLGVEYEGELRVSVKGQTSGQLRDSRLLWRLRNIAGFAALRDRMPKIIRAGLRTVFKRPIKNSPLINEDTKSFLQKELQEDISQFLGFYNRTGLWNLQD